MEKDEMLDEMLRIIDVAITSYKAQQKQIKTFGWDDVVIALDAVIKLIERHRENLIQYYTYEKPADKKQSDIDVV